jgi:hypothetical protein
MLREILSSHRSHLFPYTSEVTSDIY